MYYLIFLCLFGLSSAKTKSKLDGRIIGGQDVNIKDFPYQLSLRLDGAHFCGATIIGDTWALTAAHCVESFTSTPHRIMVYAGTTHRNEGGTKHSVGKIFIHNLFSTATLDYDVALIKVHQPFRTWNRRHNERRIRLPNINEYPPVGSLAVTSGWGVTSEGSVELPNVLKSVMVPIVSEQQCKQDYPNEVITPRMICAGYSQGGKDACQGDSGGPLVLDGKQIGIVSWGEGCAEPNSPGVYTNVAAVRDWIKEKTKL